MPSITSRLIPDFPKFEYSNKQVLRAGEALGQTLIWTDETADAIREAFSIANNWRDSHAYPMRRMRYELMAHLRIQGVKGITAARLKRMASIRNKLRRLPVNLNQIQDLAGCRAILPSIADVNQLVIKLRRKSRAFFTETGWRFARSIGSAALRAQISNGARRMLRQRTIRYGPVGPANSEVLPSERGWCAP
jgi:hypothetical protein